MSNRMAGKITWEMAARLRADRGLLIPVADAYAYEDLRLRDIAIRQKELLEEMDRLDREIRQNAMRSISHASSL